MLFDAVTYATSGIAATVALGATAIPAVRRRLLGPADPMPLTVAAALWMMLWSVEYWVGGPMSFLLMNAEADYSFGLFRFLDGHDPGGLSASALAGGIDLAGASQSIGQKLSLERLILAAIDPAWVANLVHKLFVGTTALVGMFLLARADGRCPPYVALALGAIFSLSQMRVDLVTWSHGIGFAGAPLLVYLFVVRDKPYRWAAILAGSTLYAISCAPTHGLLAVLDAMAGAVILTGRRGLGRAAGACLVLALAILLNWHESLFAKVMLGPESVRGDVHWDPLEALLPSHSWLWFVLGVAVIGATLLIDRRNCGKALAALVVAYALGGLSQAVINGIPLLAPIRPINFQNMLDGFPVIVLMQAARLLGQPAGASPAGSLLRPMAAAVIALAAGLLGWQKAYSSMVWLNQGGLSNYQAVARDLEDRSWLPAQPVRMVAVPYRLPSHAIAAAGYDTYDGVFAIIPRRLSDFWDAVLAPEGSGASSGYVVLENPRLDQLCCDSYRLGTIADLDLLRIANIGYVASVLPLTDPELHLVREGVGGGELARSTQPPLARLRTYVRMLFNPPGIKVFALPEPLPRLYAAKAVTTVEDPQAIAEIKRIALAGGAAIQLDSLQGQPPVAKAGLQVLSSDFLPDTVRVRVDAPEGGVLLLNMLHSRYWQAHADGTPIRLVPANLVQMAAEVPAHARVVEFRYARPTLAGRISEMIGTR